MRLIEITLDLPNIYINDTPLEVSIYATKKSLLFDIITSMISRLMLLSNGLLGLLQLELVFLFVILWVVSMP